MGAGIGRFVEFTVGDALDLYPRHGISPKNRRLRKPAWLIWAAPRISNVGGDVRGRSRETKADWFAPAAGSGRELSVFQRIKEGDDRESDNGSDDHPGHAPGQVADLATAASGTRRPDGVKQSPQLVILPSVTAIGQKSCQSPLLIYREARAVTTWPRQFIEDWCGIHISSHRRRDVEADLTVCRYEGFINVDNPIQ